MEQVATLVSLLVLPVGILGIAQVARWHRPRLTAVALVLSLWGMWGFHTVLALWLGAASVAPGVVGVDAAVQLEDAYGSDTAVLRRRAGSAPARLVRRAAAIVSGRRVSSRRPRSCCSSPFSCGTSSVPPLGRWRRTCFSRSRWSGSGCTC